MIDLINKKYRFRNSTDEIVAGPYVLPNGGSHPITLGTCSKYGGPAVWRTYREDGYLYDSRNETEFDLIEIIPYEDFKLDDPVLVSNDGQKWEHRHFAGVTKCGKPIIWAFGYTSWSVYSAGLDATHFDDQGIWKFCKKP